MFLAANSYQVYYIIGIINTVLAVIICPIVASYKGRSVAGWFFVGLFLGLIGIIIISFVKSENKNSNSNVNKHNSYNYKPISNNYPKEEKEYLNRLYTIGSISKEEYERRIQRLKK